MPNTVPGAEDVILNKTTSLLQHSLYYSKHSDSEQVVQNMWPVSAGQRIRLAGCDVIERLGDCLGLSR